MCEQQFQTGLWERSAWVTLGSEVTPPALAWVEPSSSGTEIRTEPDSHQHLSLRVSRRIKKVSTVIDETLFEVSTLF